MDIRSMFPPKSPFQTLFGAFYPHPAHQSALRAEGATHFLAPGQRGCSTVPLATVLPPPAPRPTPGPAGSGRAQTLPLAYCMQPTAELTKVEQDPISTSGASIFSMSPNQAIPTEKLIRFFPTRRHPIVDHSLVPRGAQRQWLQACVPDGHQPQCMFSLYPPYTPDEFTRVGLVLHHTSQDFLSPPQILL